MKAFSKRIDVLFFLFILISLYVLAVFAPFFAPYGYDDEQRQNIHKPPDRIRFFDTDGKFHLRPFFYPKKRTHNEFRRRVYQEDRKNPVKLEFFVPGHEYKLLGFINTTAHLFGTKDRIPVNILGTDSRGRDLWSRVCFGSRVSLSIGLIGAFITFVLGMTFGSIAGFYGKHVDFIIMRICEMI